MYIDTVSGYTVSGTTSIPKNQYSKLDELSSTATKLIVEKNQAMRPLESSLQEIVSRALENPGAPEQYRHENQIIILNSNIYGSALGGDVRHANLTFIQEWNQIKNEVDTKVLRQELDSVIGMLRKHAKKEEDYTDLANLTFARDELNKADGPAMLTHLKKVGSFGLDIAKEAAASIIVKLITGT